MLIVGIPAQSALRRGRWEERERRGCSRVARRGLAVRQLRWSYATPTDIAFKVLERRVADLDRREAQVAALEPEVNLPVPPSDKTQKPPTDTAT